MFLKGDPGHTYMYLQLLASTAQWSPKRTENWFFRRMPPFLESLCMSNDAAWIGHTSARLVIRNPDLSQVPLLSCTCRCGTVYNREPVGTGQFCLRAQTGSIKGLFACFLVDALTTAIPLLGRGFTFLS